MIARVCMKAGISTACYYPMRTEQALEHIVEAQAEACEIFFNAPSELDSSYIRRLNGILAGSNTKVRSVHPFTSGMEGLFFFSDYERRFWDGIEFYKQYFHAAASLGAEIVVFHGDHRHAERPLGLYADRYGRIMEEARKMGVILAHENVVRCVGYTPSFFTALRMQLPDAKFVLDVKQSIRAQVSPADMLDAMGNAVVHLHISDHNERSDCLPVGRGELDAPALFNQLDAYGFDQVALLEVYRDSYEDYNELSQSYHYMKALTMKYG